MRYGPSETGKKESLTDEPIDGSVLSTTCRVQRALRWTPQRRCRLSSTTSNLSNSNPSTLQPVSVRVCDRDRKIVFVYKLHEAPRAQLSLNTSTVPLWKSKSHTYRLNQLLGCHLFSFFQRREGFLRCHHLWKPKAWTSLRPTLSNLLSILAVLSKKSCWKSKI